MEESKSQLCSGEHEGRVTWKLFFWEAEGGKSEEMFAVTTAETM